MLPDYSVDLLDARTHRTVETHLSLCEGCRDELRIMDSVMTLVERHGVRQPPAGLFNAVRNQIESGEIRRDRPVWWAWLYSRPARAAAMGMAMAALALGILMPVSTTRLLPSPDLHGDAQVTGGMMASGALASSIRQHALSAGEGPLADRVAWEAMAQLVAQDKDRRGGSTEVQ